MSPSESLVKDLDEKHVDLVAKLASDIKTGKLEGSNNIALAMVALLEQIISDSENATAIGLVNSVRAAGRLATHVMPAQLAAANMARRVLRALRDEARAQTTSSVQSGAAGESLQRLVLAAPARRATLGPDARDLREPIRDHIAELRTELEGTFSSISSQASSHVHAGETLLTYGAGRLAERFLMKAAARQSRVLLAEAADPRESHAMAARLSAAGVSVTVLSSAAVYAVMSRVNKVVVEATAALAGGAALGAPGLHAVAAAAKHHCVPVLVLCPLYALCPVHAHHPAHRAALASPAPALPYQSPHSARVHVYAPQYDLVPADHITLFITNLGGSSPSYIYRLLSELYDPNDYTL